LEVGIQNFFGVEFENKLQKENVDGLSVEVEEGDLIPAGLMSTDWRLDAVVSQLLKEVFFSLSRLCLPAVTLHLLGRALREWMGKNKENFLFYRLPPEGDFLEWRERRRRRRWKMHTTCPTNKPAALYPPATDQRPNSPGHLGSSHSTWLKNLERIFFFFF
jgi:hypothetical protein